MKLSYIASLMALLAATTASAEDIDNDIPVDPGTLSTCKFANGSTAYVQQDGSDLVYFHTNKAGETDLDAILATGYGFNNIQHTVQESIRFTNGAYSYVAISDPMTKFYGVMVYNGNKAIAKQKCVGGWSPYLISPPDSSQLHDDGVDFLG
ncbi:hypothetical protein I9F91_001582 [Salmonella enterica]|nr:hypothetical protein CHD23_19975 [Salmonella enterica]EAW1150041.1 hypothetical protein [Salmonella enterica subsp. houtenae]EBI0041624.1 hypothetical protein [Salmonella enterica subsp. diarizonae serovar 61:k:z35]EDU0973006.1 hypothetical protein [Salmonella enterica subsp. arizonae serovar 38:z4,z23:-]EIW3437687.1 hypothetical protein [Salmonella enterica subsp. houtenae serovar 38:z4,z23:-]